MSKVNFIIGIPVEFKKLCLVYPPKLKEVIAEKRYSIYAKILTFSQEEIDDEIIKNNGQLTDTLTPFEYILNSAFNNVQFKFLVEQAFYFFIHEKVMLLPEQKQIIIGDIKDIKGISELRVLKEEDYFDFQNLVRQSIGGKAIEKPNPNEDPRVRRIKAKARYRDRVKAEKGAGLNLETMIASISCMQMGLNPLNIGELSYAAIPVLIATYQQKEKYQLDVESLLAGADSKKIKPKYWIGNLDN